MVLFPESPVSIFLGINDLCLMCVNCQVMTVLTDKWNFLCPVNVSWYLNGVCIFGRSSTGIGSCCWAEIEGVPRLRAERGGRLGDGEQVRLG